MNERISNIFDYDDEIVVVKEQDDLIDPARIKELTMKRIHDEGTSPVEMKRAVKKTRPAWRIILIAAVVAVLLIGTALAVYQYTLKDAAIEDVPTRDSELYEWKAGETETRLSLNGFADSPEYQAYVEWTDWNREWNAAHPDPWKELGEDDSYYETPGNYLTYDAWFTEQGDTLDAIAEKYGLTLLGEHIGFRTESQLCGAIGAENIVADGYDIYGDYLFPNGTFKAVGDTVIGGRAVDFTVWNSVKGSFVPFSDIIPEDYKEWSYTTKDSFEVILMTDNLRARTDIIAPLSGSFVTATLRTDDAQAAQDFADAIDLRALDALFATDSARAAAAQSIADYVEGLSTATTLGETSEDEQTVLDYLGDWYPAELPEGYFLYNMQVTSPDFIEDLYAVSRRYDSKEHGELTLFYRELEPLDGENAESRQALAAYTEDAGPSGEPRTFCAVGGYEALLVDTSTESDAHAIYWLDTDRQLLFRMGAWDMPAEDLITLAESITGTAPETPPVRNASTEQERFQHSLMPLSQVRLYQQDMITQSIETKRILTELGNYGLTEIPNVGGIPLTAGQILDSYGYYWDGLAVWSQIWQTYSSSPELGADALTLTYKRFNDGRTTEAYEAEKRYDDHFGEITNCKVGRYDGYFSADDFFDGVTFVEWYDADRDLIFRVSAASYVYAFTEETLIAMAESVAELPWTGVEFGYESTERGTLFSDLGTYALPGGELGSIALSDDTRASRYDGDPFWYVEDDPYVGESVYVTFADGTMLGWQRTWADTARTTENGAASFAAITRYLLACDDADAVRTGLAVNGYDAIFVAYPGDSDWGNAAHTELMWYDEDAGLIFTIADYPDEGSTPRTAAQLITLAESVTAQ